MTKQIKRRIRGTNIVQDYTLHDSPRAAIETYRGREWTMIALLENGEIFYDMIPRGQPLPVDAVVVPRGTPIECSICRGRGCAECNGSGSQRVRSLRYDTAAASVALRGY